MLLTHDLLDNIPGLSWRTLDYWAQSGVVRPLRVSGIGQGGIKRVYSPQQAFLAMVLTEFRKHGLNANRIRVVADAIQRLERKTVPHWLVYGDDRITGRGRLEDALKVAVACKGPVIVVDTLPLREAEWLRGERAA